MKYSENSENASTKEFLLILDNSEFKWKITNYKIPVPVGTL